MSKGECLEPRPDCKYYPDCFSDQHHLYGRAKNHIGKIARKFSELPENKIQMCRREHEELHANDGILELPSTGVMQEAVVLWRRTRYDGV